MYTDFNGLIFSQFCYNLKRHIVSILILFSFLFCKTHIQANTHSCHSKLFNPRIMECWNWTEHCRAVNESELEHWNECRRSTQSLLWKLCPALIQQIWWQEGFYHLKMSENFIKIIDIISDLYSNENYASNFVHEF